MTRKTIWQPTLILILAGVPALAGPGRADREPTRLPIERLAERLELGAEEVASLKAIDRERIVRIAEIRSRARLLRYDLEELMAAETIDRQAVFAKLDELGAVHTEIVKEQYAARIQVRELLGDRARRLDRFLERRGAHRLSRRGDRAERGRRAPRAEPAPELEAQP